MMSVLQKCVWTQALMQDTARARSGPTVWQSPLKATEHDIVVNMQGDEPLVPPLLLEQVKALW
jgi:CMP-2-keto-3-deoxyoctulosonic acid synthetase